MSVMPRRLKRVRIESSLPPVMMMIFSPRRAASCRAKPSLTFILRTNSPVGNTVTMPSVITPSTSKTKARMRPRISL